jgi:hypothetical protein
MGTGHGGKGRIGMSKERPQDVRDIVVRIGQRPSNPVARARLMVEQEVPVSRRGPGWDRHWRELEAYLEDGCEWRGTEARDAAQVLDDAIAPEADKKKGRSEDQPVNV